METATLEAKVYAALTADGTLTGLLPAGAQAIFHMQAPGGDYSRTPLIVYSTVSDVPILHGDDAEEMHRVILRIHIITDDGEYAGIYEAVKRVMYAIGFSRHQTTALVDKGKKMLAADFKITTGG